ncbi:MAG: Uma2 family endonuclease [Alphaproteobacteria bacterium]|nr:Uma2 family endonuclease [Alphaproteobacteria bacterium]
MTARQHTEPLHYPDSDGQPIADNTLQYRWIVTIQGNLDVLLPDFVAGDLLWYPVEGAPHIRVAPDVLVALGRPKGDRGSYKQWEEDGVPPAVVFEVMSPGNTAAEMSRKALFYRNYGAQEFYLVDPDRGTLQAWVLADRATWGFQQIEDYTSPLLGIRLTSQDGELALYKSDGSPFLSFSELAKAAADAEQARQDAEQARQDAEQARQAAERRAEVLAERLRALGIDPDAP